MPNTFDTSENLSIIAVAFQYPQIHVCYIYHDLPSFGSFLPKNESVNGFQKKTYSSSPLSELQFAVGQNGSFRIQATVIPKRKQQLMPQKKANRIL